MNHYTQLLQYLKQLLEADEMVNTVTKGKIEMLDSNKMDIGILAHILVSSPNFGNGQTISFSVDLTVVGQVNVNNDIDNDKFWSNDNEVDVLNETLAVLNRSYSKLLRDFEDVNITAVQDAVATEVEATKNNMIGWSLPFQVIMPNDVIRLCS